LAPGLKSKATALAPDHYQCDGGSVNRSAAKKKKNDACSRFESLYPVDADEAVAGHVGKDGGQQDRSPLVLDRLVGRRPGLQAFGSDDHGFESRQTFWCFFFIEN
jgi:hypothetical protein